MSNDCPTPIASCGSAPEDSKLLFRRAFRLTPRREASEQLVCRADIGVKAQFTTVYLPNSDDVHYIVVPWKGAKLSVVSEDFQIELLGSLGDFAARARELMIFKRKKVLMFSGFRIYALGPRLARKIFSATARRMMKSGVPLDGPTIQKHPELLLGWRNEAEPAPPVAGKSDGSVAVAIVVHIYYEETWSEISTILQRLDLVFDLIVTVSAGNDRLAEKIRHDFPQADIHTTENRGRDVRPFLALLEQGALDRYQYVCKIHGKKSHDGGRMAVLGAIWRNRMLFDLLAAPGVTKTILDLFDHEANVGMVGSDAYRYPSHLCSMELSWGQNRPRVLELAAKMGISANRFKLDFFCGTMFWVRPEALRPLRDLALASAFPDEMGKLDGALEHAVERLFSTATVAAGYRIETTNGATCCEPANETCS